MGARMVVLGMLFVAGMTIVGAQEEAAGQRKIAFVGAKGQVYTINEDGTGEKKLTDLPNTMYFSIQCSADGKVIVGTFHGTHTISADGGSVKKLEGGSAMERETSPAFSPDGTKIVCVTGRSMTNDVWVMDADGKNRKQLTTTENVTESWPVWSPDGKRIAYVAAEWVEEGGGSKTLAPSEVYVMNADGSGSRRLTENGAKASGLVWSPDGSKVLFTSDQAKEKEGVRYSNNDVAYVLVEGSGMANLTQDNDGDDTFPTWSPDGNTILLVSRRKGGPNSLYTMNANGSDVKALLEPKWGPEFSSPVYSSDGKKILVRDSYADICILNADGTGMAKLAKGTHYVWVTTK